MIIRFCIKKSKTTAYVQRYRKPENNIVVMKTALVSKADAAITIW